VTLKITVLWIFYDVQYDRSLNAIRRNQLRPSLRKKNKPIMDINCNETAEGRRNRQRGALPALCDPVSVQTFSKLGSLLRPEVGAGRFLRNFGNNLPDCTASPSRRQKSLLFLRKLMNTGFNGDYNVAL
jgi:hypothetical protein